MNKELLIMRHAKSDWPSDITTDKDRPLNKRGRTDAPKMAQHLIDNDLVPQLSLISPAVRTMQTWQLMKQIFLKRGLHPEERVVSDFYLGGFLEIQNAIHSVSNDITRVLILGHNPGWSRASSVLANSLIDLTTANVVVLQHTSPSWSEAIKDDRWWLHAHFIPKYL